MTTTEFKNQLQRVETIQFRLPNGELVPPHFHITEIGVANNTFIDCGGTIRELQKVSVQLWSANDYNHRLHPNKIVDIIEIAERNINLPNAEIEVEYQGETIEKFGLNYTKNEFVLTPQFTDCLAKDNCGIPTKKPKLELANLGSKQPNSCDPTTGCC